MKITKATLGIDKETFEPLIKFEGYYSAEDLRNQITQDGPDAAYRHFGEDFIAAIREEMQKHELFKENAGLV